MIRTTRWISIEKEGNSGSTKYLQFLDQMKSYWLQKKNSDEENT
jgi:hypothetical protein